MISSLDAIARESDAGGDDKEQLNAHIMTIGTCLGILFAIIHSLTNIHIVTKKICITFIMNYEHIKFRSRI
jgi:hypothetical protein